MRHLVYLPGIVAMSACTSISVQAAPGCAVPAGKQMLASFSTGKNWSILRTRHSATDISACSTAPVSYGFVTCAFVDCRALPVLQGARVARRQYARRAIERIGIAAAFTLLTACADSPQPWVVESLSSPAQSGSGQAHLSGGGGLPLVLSWQAPTADGGTVLQASQFDGGAWLGKGIVGDGPIPKIRRRRRPTNDGTTEDDR